MEPSTAPMTLTEFSDFVQPTVDMVWIACGFAVMFLAFIAAFLAVR